MDRNKSGNVGSADKKESIFQRMKHDKQYSAKMQLLGWGVFIGLLIIVLNLSSMGGSGDLSEDIIYENVIGSNDKDTIDDEDINLLEKVNDNYSYDVFININRKSINNETKEEVIVEENIQYSGKSYGNSLEINKKNDEDSNLYYRVDNNYYSMIDNITSSVKEMQVYDVISGEYVELDNILVLLDKASLEYVTNFSSGKRVSLYRLLVKELIGGFYGNEYIEINIEEENEVLKIMIDYSNLFKISDESIDSCKVDIVVTNIDKVEEFEVVVSTQDNDLGGDVNIGDNASLNQCFQ